jgi:hypothetical protein
MQCTHDGMTIAERRLLQFWLDAQGWRDWQRGDQWRGPDAG